MILRNMHAAERYCRGFLLEYKTYLDHMQTTLTHEYGNESQILKDFKDGTHSAFNATPEYAFTYYLRNCSQHCENVVHRVTATKGMRGIHPKADPKTLLSTWDGWKKQAKDFLSSHPGEINLLNVFIKTHDALASVHVPVMQYMLHQGNTASNLQFLRRLADWLLTNYSDQDNDIWDWHFAHAVHADGTEATVEEYRQKFPDIRFDVQVLDWETLMNLCPSIKYCPS